MNINLEYYKIFYYVGKLKSITLAAEALAISQPAVSQAVKHLEESLGSPLFVRTAKGVRFTAEGEIFYSYVERGYEYILLGEKKFKELQNLENGEIRIGASDMTLQFFLLSYLERFHEKHPQIKVTVTNAPTPETLKHLSTGKIDFGVVSTPMSQGKHNKVVEVKEIQDVFVAGKKFEYLKEKKLSYSELGSLPVMCLEGETSTRKYVKDFLMERGVSLQPEFELATSSMLIQFAIRSLGIASVVRDFAVEEMESGRLFELSFQETIPRRKFAIVTDERIPVSKAAGKLLRFIREDLGV